MSRIDEIDSWDWPDYEMVQDYDSYDMKRVPRLSRENFEYLVKKHNEVVAYVREMEEKMNHVSIAAQRNAGGPAQLDQYFCGTRVNLRSW